jgi:putative intracellular protease/amidase
MASTVRGVESVGAPAQRVGAQVVVPSDGGAVDVDHAPLEVTERVLTLDSVEYDALVVAGGSSAEALSRDPYIAVILGEAYHSWRRHVAQANRIFPKTS